MIHPLLDLAGSRTVLLDGAMGTELMARGLVQGTAPESWNTERPEVVREVHAAYFAAGADVVSTNSFGGSALKLAGHGLEGRTYELNLAAARLARSAAPPGRYVAGSMGPTGKFLKPQGEYAEEDFAAAYAEQARGLADGGVDVLLIETQYDLREALAALRGARSVSGLPVFVTMTFNAFPRGYFTLMGDTAARAAAELGQAGAAAVGANCTLASEQMVGCVKAIRQATSLPIVAQANAGQPSIDADGRVVYSQGLEDYVSYVPEIVRAGAGFVGGCCGTNPSYIRAMAGKIK
jgi:5-methyltetrahydrofolate--homocysteine methyltransferase